MPNLIGDSIKAFLRDGIKAAGGTFGSGGGQSGGVGRYGSGFGDRRGNLFGWHAGSGINWNAITGDMLRNPIARTCLSIILDNYCQADIVVQKKKGDEWETDPKHPLSVLLQNPNGLYSWEYLQRGVLLSMYGKGNGYIGIETDGRGKPSEFKWLSSGVVPERTDAGVLKNWLYTRPGGKQIPVPLEEIIKIPSSIPDPASPGFGLGVDEAIKQDQYVLQQGGNYTANVMRNNGTVGVILTPKTIKDENGNVVQTKLDGEDVVNAWRKKTRGDGAGDAMYLDYPLDTVFPKNTPNDLALNTILDRPENTVCAVMRVPIILVGAYGGREAKTYANYEQAREALWEECLLPLQKIVAAELGRHLLPLFGSDPAEYRVAYNTDNVRALQPDLDKQHERVRSDFQANVIDLYTAELETGRDAQEEHRGIYYWMFPKIADNATITAALLPDAMRDEFMQAEEEQKQQQAQQDAARLSAMASGSPNAGRNGSVPAISGGKD